HSARQRASLNIEDVHLVHRLWLNITREPGLDKLHHLDMLTGALTRFARDYAGHDRDDILKGLRKSSGKTVPSRPVRGDGFGDRSQPLPERSANPVRDKKKGDEGPPSP